VIFNKMKPILITTKGFTDQDLVKKVFKNELLLNDKSGFSEFYEIIIEVDESIDENGFVIQELSEGNINKALRQIYKTDFSQSILIVFQNSLFNPTHEIILENILRTAGYFSVQAFHKIVETD
jgi:N-methylhydantoinase A/oxoprolinase/acetone carboxylase beta subunit